jgi:hypothetical protein
MEYGKRRPLRKCGNERRSVCDPSKFRMVFYAEWRWKVIDCGCKLRRDKLRPRNFAEIGFKEKSSTSIEQDVIHLFCCTIVFWGVSCRELCQKRLERCGKRCLYIHLPFCVVLDQNNSSENVTKHSGPCFGKTCWACHPSLKPDRPTCRKCKNAGKENFLHMTNGSFCRRQWSTSIQDAMHINTENAHQPLERK